MVRTEPLLDVFSVLIENHLGGGILAETHALGELLEGFLHFLKLFRWDVVFFLALVCISSCLLVIALSRVRVFLELIGCKILLVDCEEAFLRGGHGDWQTICVRDK